MSCGRVVSFVKILAIIGSPRIGRTYKMVQKFEQKLNTYAKIHFEYIHLKDFNIQSCRGCEVCLKQGDTFCPLKDDTAFIFKKMMDADGIIFATPNYSLQVSASMKTLLDRLAYVFHRPCFFHKSSLAIVTQGVYGGKEILKYFESVGQFWGFNVCKGVGLTTPSNDLLPYELEKIERKLSLAAERFYKALLTAKSPTPNFLKLWIFRFVRTFHAINTDNSYRDYHYFKENGWFESQYYYDVKLCFVKKLFGTLADRYATKLAYKAKKDREKTITSPPNIKSNF